MRAKSKNENKWYVIEDPAYTEIILKSYGDEDKKKILTSVVKSPDTVSNILKRCMLPQTSAYRKINSLIKVGLLVQNGFNLIINGRKIPKYMAMFENLKINIIKDAIIVKVKINRSGNLKNPNLTNLIHVETN